MVFLSESFRVIFLYCAILPAGLLGFDVNGESQDRGAHVRELSARCSGISLNAVPGMSSERRRR